MTHVWHRGCIWFEDFCSRHIRLGHPEEVSVVECALFWSFEIPAHAVAWWYPDYAVMKSSCINVQQSFGTCNTFCVSSFYLFPNWAVCIAKSNSLTPLLFFVSILHSLFIVPTVPSESLRTVLIFLHFVKLQPYAKRKKNYPHLLTFNTS